MQQYRLCDFLNSLPAEKPVPDYEFKRRSNESGVPDEASTADHGAADAAAIDDAALTERNRIFAGHKILAKMRGCCAATDGFCATCWLTMPCCICDKLAAVIEQSRAQIAARSASATPSTHTRIKFVVVMAFEEFLRSSNTGKVLLQTHAVDTELLLVVRML